MDGLWSSPDLAALLRLAARNREALALVGRLVPRPGPAARGRSRTGRDATRAGQPAQHRGALRPRQRPLPAVPRRDDDVLERGLRVAGPVARRRAAQQVPASSPSAPGCGAAARPGDRHRLGRLRAVRGRRAGLPGDVDHDLAASSTSWPASGSRRPAWSDLVDVQLRDYRDIEGTYDAIVSIEMLEAVGAEYFATFFETCDRALRARRPDEPPVDHLPGRRVRARSAAARTGSRRTSSRAACARRSRSSSGRPTTPAC